MDKTIWSFEASAAYLVRKLIFTSAAFGENCLNFLARKSNTKAKKESLSALN